MRFARAMAVGLFALAALSAASGPTGNLEDWTNDCKGEPGPGTAAACSKALASGKLDTRERVSMLRYRAESYIRGGHYDQAIADCDSALALEHDNADVLYFRAEAYERAGRPREALADYDRLVALKPNLYLAYEDRALAYAGDKQYDRALADLDRALALAPGMPKPVLERALVLLEAGRYREAVRAFDEQVARYPGNPFPVMARGKAYLSWTGGPPDRLARARKDFDAAIALKPHLADAYELRAAAEDAQGDTAAASADRAKAKTLASAP